jgi:hypothetical protein
MVEKFTNFARSSIVSAISDTDSTLEVEYATNFPTTGDFRLRCGNELMLCTGVSGATFTVTRGVESTTAAAHAAGSPIAHVMTAGSLDAAIETHRSGLDPYYEYHSADDLDTEDCVVLGANITRVTLGAGSS